VIAIEVDDPNQGLIWWKKLLEQGIYVNLVLPPATPTGGALLRCSLSAAHSNAQVDRIQEALCGLRTMTEAHV
jgi:8-amino-7-oxononanoate synthase